VYDGYLQLEQLNAVTNAIEKKRVWEPGGSRLLAESHSSLGVFTSYYALSDANKNITEYIDSTGIIQGHFEYSPFGKITVASGTMPDSFDFRFSSEYFDAETGLVYYNFRYYSPKLGRWLSRDLIEEDGGINLYGWIWNDGINEIDLLGLKICYRWMFLTFYTGQKKQGNKPGDPQEKVLTEMDAADANRRYTPAGPGKAPILDKNAPANEPYRPAPYVKGKWNPGRTFRIHRGRKGIDTRTVNDSGKGWAIARPGLPMGVDPEEWLDLWTPTEEKAKKLGESWAITEMDVDDDCPCPEGWSTENPPPVPENMKKY
jgi:RHS repeat-associated protein